MDLLSRGCYQIDFKNSVMTVKARGKAKRELSNESRKSPFDVTLMVEGKPILAHKEVLMDNMEYFRAMFSSTFNFREASQSVIDLGPHVDFHGFSKLMNLMYKGNMQVTVTDVQPLFHLADLWGLSFLLDSCTDFITRELEATNCFEVLQFAKNYNCKKLMKACKHLAQYQFQAVATTQGFMNLSFKDLIHVLETRHLRLGDRGEDLILDAVMKWWKQDKENRLGKMGEVLQRVISSGVSDKCKRKYLKDPAIKEIVQTWMERNEVGTRRCNNVILMISGFLQSRTGSECPKTCTVEKFDPRKKAFSILAHIPKPPQFAVAFNLYGLILYIAVSHVSNPETCKNNYSAVVWCYNPLVDIWIERKDVFSSAALEKIKAYLVLERPIVHCGFKNKIYLLSVEESLSINITCKEGDVRCDLGAPLPSMLPILDQSHRGLRGVSHKGKLFVMGGCFGPELDTQVSNMVLALSDNGSKWECKASMIDARSYFTVVSCGDYIYVVGGYFKLRLQKCERYLVKENKWQAFTPLQQAKTHHATVVVNNVLFTLGGKTYSSQKFDAPGVVPKGARIVSDLMEVERAFVEEHEMEGRYWTTSGRLSTPRCSFQAVVL